jgi:hypothetical protein
MKTISKIDISPIPSEFVKYTHCSGSDAAKHLRSDIEELEDLGFSVLSGVAARPSVPTCYKSAYKVHAPYWVFYILDRKIVMIDGKLENRSRGAAIPARFEISGHEIPKGFRCFRRLENSVEIRRA